MILILPKAKLMNKQLTNGFNQGRMKVLSLFVDFDINFNADFNIKVNKKMCGFPIIRSGSSIIQN